MAQLDQYQLHRREDGRIDIENQALGVVGTFDTVAVAQRWLEPLRAADYEDAGDIEGCYYCGSSQHHTSYHRADYVR